MESAASWLLAGRIGPVEGSAILEMTLLGLLPSAKKFIDGEELEGGEAVRVFGERLRRARPVVVPGPDLLPFFRVQKLQVGLGGFGCTMPGGHFVPHRDRRLRQNADRRRDHFELVFAQFVERQEGFILPGEQHVPNASLSKSGGGTAGA